MFPVYSFLKNLICKIKVFNTFWYIIGDFCLLDPDLGRFPILRNQINMFDVLTHCKVPTVP